MSLDDVRNATSRAKKNEITTCELSRKRKLRELYACAAFLNAAHQPKLHDLPFDAEPDENELRFLDENDIAKGRYFRDSTLPSPYQNAKVSPKSPSISNSKAPVSFSSTSSPPSIAGGAVAADEQPRGASASPNTVTQSKPCGPADSDDVVLDKITDGDSTHVPRPKRLKLSEENEDQALHPRGDVLSDGPSIDPKKDMPITSEDIANLPELEIPSQDSTTTPRPPQVVHLPPKEEQERHLREIEHAQEKAVQRERKEDERLGLPHGSVTGELASSPSSTVGPYSTATPHPNHHSPDTSPDEETFRDSVAQLRQPDTERRSEEQTAKAEHDNALKWSMKAARESARAHSPETPDAQLQLEDEQAIRLARDSNYYNSKVPGGPPSFAGESHSLTSQAEDAVPEKQSNDVSSHIDSPSGAQIVDTVPPTSTDTLEGKVPNLATPTEQPTPPVDVEMQDAPIPVSHEKQAKLLTPNMEDITAHALPAIPKTPNEKIQSSLSLTAPVNGALTPSSTRASTSGSPSQPRNSERKDRSKLSVVFAKQENVRPVNSLQLYNEDYAALRGASHDSSKDYLQGLFSFQAHHPPRSTPLQELLSSSRKTVTTSNTLASLRECQDYKILKRVYQLQNANRWSLRQIQKCAEPPRPTCHLDHLLTEMRWMHTDFKEERKWKVALASTFAEWCAEYVASSPKQRESLRIRVRPHRKLDAAAETNDDEMQDAPTPDLIPSNANETESESFPEDDDVLSGFNGLNAPVGLFSLGYGDVVMKMERTPASDALLQELPAYEPTLVTGQSAADTPSTSTSDPPILPVSKLVTGKLVSLVTGPPRKRSRYEYEQEDEPVNTPSRSHTSEHSMPSTPGRRFNRNDLPPEMTDVALFNPENKHVRDRIQAGHAFRPPSEFAMPSTNFFESRVSSQWLWDEDQKLRSLVKEYTFNWSLIALALSLPSLFTSGAERRTPWECFERWVQLEGLPAEMSKTQYFRTYQSRLEAAQRTVSAQHQALQQQLQQQAQAAGQTLSSQVRRRTTQPIRVERRKNNRYLAIIDGMRKLARKRESAAHKQQESAKAAQLRKAHEAAAPKTSVHTPQEFSRLKYEREVKILEKQEQYRINLQRAAAAQRQGQVAGQPSAMPNGVSQPQRNGTPNINAPGPSPLANSTSQSGHPSTNINMQARSHSGQPSMQSGFPNGNISGISMGVQGIPQAQMQANIQGQQRMPPPENMRLAMQRGQYPPTNQHQFQLQQQQINLAGNISASHIGAGNGMPNPSMIASMTSQNMNGNSNPSINGISGSAASPRMSQLNPSLQNQSRSLSSGHVPAIHNIQNQLKAQHPEWSPEQVTKAATDQMKQYSLRAQRASAINAAAGVSAVGAANQIGSNVYLQNGGAVAGSPSPNSAQNYQQLRQQMMHQRPQQAGSPRLNSARPPSRSATPQNPQLQQSPGLPQAQLARN
ncbi:hypothetical protein AOQ84DRAFT_307448 [Glonium stellatum]|uniref:Vacuolar import and degradation protein 21 n=1 Tax=Glonium stellatum TaxID=574774 RepID=A0A8E2FDS3_9PEZI|nr:hypothetical protein AOQ84DRAFT_307448 [Glonium stellatum]